MKKKFEIAANISALPILPVMVFFCIYEYSEHSSCGGVCFFSYSIVLYEFFIIASFTAAAALLNLLIRTAGKIFNKNGSGREISAKEIFKACFDTLAVLIVFGGQINSIIEFISAMNCHGNSAAPYYMLLFIVPAIVLAAVVWGISRLILVFLRK